MAEYWWGPIKLRSEPVRYLGDDGEERLGLLAEAHFPSGGKWELVVDFEGNRVDDPIAVRSGWGLGRV